MYTPEIKPEFIHLLYLHARALSQKQGRRVSMVKLVNDIINQFLDNLEKGRQQQSI